MIIRLDANSAVPPYAQLRQQIGTMIRSGVLAPEARLPAIRHLANDLGVAVNTVARSYRELELGHPVRSFVVVLLLVGAALLGVRWSGIVHPQLSLSASGSGGGSAEAGREYRMVLLQNDGLVPLRIEAIDWSTRGWTDVRFGVLPAGVGYEGPRPSPTTAGAATFEPFTLHGGWDEARWIVMSGRPPCPGRPISESVELRARTWAGVERTVSVAGPEAGSSDAEVCP